MLGEGYFEIPVFGGLDLAFNENESSTLYLAQWKQEKRGVRDGKDKGKISVSVKTSLGKVHTNHKYILFPKGIPPLFPLCEAKENSFHSTPFSSLVLLHIAPGRKECSHSPPPENLPYFRCMGRKSCARHDFMVRTYIPLAMSVLLDSSPSRFCS